MKEKTVEFNINLYMELSCKDMPEPLAEHFRELILNLKAKKIDSKKDGIMRIDVEEIKHNEKKND